MNKTAYPLCWPAGWPTTEPFRRERARFKTNLASALKCLEDEIRLLGGKGTILSSNYTLGAQNPKESGVVAYFTYEGSQVAIPCDRWIRVEHNVKAIALTINAMRGMERWGAKHMIKAMFSGFKALPEAKQSEAWHEVLGVDPKATAAQIQEAYRYLAKIHHPDKGGSHEQMVKIGNAFTAAQQLGLVP